MGEKLGPVLFGQFSAKRIDGDDEGSPVCLELQHKQKDEVRRSRPEDTVTWFLSRKALFEILID